MMEVFHTISLFLLLLLFFLLFLLFFLHVSPLFLFFAQMHGAPATGLVQRPERPFKRGRDARLYRGISETFYGVLSVPTHCCNRDCLPLGPLYLLIPHCLYLACHF